jgi:hypothetical protein
VIDLSVLPKLANSFSICSLPLATPHFGKYTLAPHANKSKIDPPEITPPLSNALVPLIVSS